MANPELEVILRNGVSRWNKWRKDNLEELIDLTELDFAGNNLRGVILSKADLSNADLREAELIGADLSKANLRGVDLSGADLSNADLSGADLSDADLSDADLTDANLNGTDFSKAYLNDVSFINADLSQAIFREATLLEADFTKTSLRNTDFTQADLSWAGFYNCPTLIQAIGLTEIVCDNESPLSLDVSTLRGCVLYLPDDFLLKAGYTIEELPRLRAMYGGKEVVTDNSNTLTFSFDFPEEVKVKCEQYLLFFRQFLEELGVKAKTEVNENIAGEVLFSVEPTDQKIALEKIRQALDVYLLMPAISDLQAPSFADHPAHYLIKREVDNLKRDLETINTLMQMKDATIASLQETVSRQNIPIDGSMIINAYRGQVSPKPIQELPENVELLDGVVQITRLGGDGQGFMVDLPRIIREFPTLRSVTSIIDRLARLFVEVEPKNKSETKELPPPADR